MTDVSSDVSGDVARLSDGRIVFLGTHPDHPKTWFIAFRNEQGYDTRLKLSYEAMTALIQMVSTFPPPALNPFPPKEAEDQSWNWQVAKVSIEPIAKKTPEKILVSIGQQLRYIGEKCALVPGNFYLIQAISIQEDTTYVMINAGYYRLDSFRGLKIEVGDTVQYNGSDAAVGNERIFIVKELKNWGGTPYVTIITEGNMWLSYPLADFTLI